MAEVYTNAIPRTLTADITSGATSLTVSAATGFPASGNFSIKIEDEIIRVGAISGTTLSSLTRGAESTTAAAHTSGKVVLHVITKTALDNIIIEAGGPIVFPAGTKKTFSPDATNSGLNVGSLAGNPSSLANGDLWYNSSGNALNARINGATVALGAGGGSGATISTGADASKAGTPAGDAYLPDNGFQLYRYTGSASAGWGPIFPLTDPTLPSFAWINQGGATVTTTNGGIHLSAPANAGDSLRIREITAPATPYTITVRFLPLLYPENFHSIGLCFRASGAGTIQTFHLNQNGSLQVSKWNSPTSFSADYVGPLAAVQIYGAAGLCFQISDDGTNRICRYSTDGVNFLQLHSVGRTDFLTADRIGFFADSNNAAHAAGITLLHWKQT